MRPGHRAATPVLGRIPSDAVRRERQGATQNVLADLDRIAERVRGEYLEMPGLRLTTA